MIITNYYLAMVDYYDKKGLDVGNHEKKVNELLTKAAGILIYNSDNDLFITRKFEEKIVDLSEYRKVYRGEITQDFEEMEWKDYSVNKIIYTDRFSEKLTELEELIFSPIIPNDLIMKLGEFEKELTNNVLVIQNELNKIVKSENFEKLDFNKQLSHHRYDILNKCLGQKEVFDRKIINVLEYIKSYLRSDSIMSNS
ncbi:MAG: hypothetical protein WD334_12530 [Chitinophagales bacterium]